MLKHKQNSTGTQGFTLVELSIVIIIIGFLIAGIAAGTSLIKQAELNSVVTDFQSYQTAYNNFLGRYGKAPGDFSSGSAVWGTTACPAADCDGNGNGVINADGTLVNEGLAAWKHLSLASMISSGITLPTVANQYTTALVSGTNIPLSKVSGAGYMMMEGTSDGATTPGSLPAATLLNSTNLWNDNKTNAVFLAKSPTTASGFMTDGAIKGEEAFNIDKKLDDGNVSGTAFQGANTGNIRVAGDSTAATGCLDNTTVTEYNPAGTAAACVVALALN